MIDRPFASLAYLVASLLFILSLRGLSTQESARRGNRFGIIGMLIAVRRDGAGAAGCRATARRRRARRHRASACWPARWASAASIGALLATRVAMTSMPELVAILHSFVGAAAVLVGIATYLQPAGVDAADRSAHLVEIYVGVLVGAVTFSGSMIAFGKLRGMIGSKPLLLPGPPRPEPASSLMLVRGAGRDLPARRGRLARRRGGPVRRGDAGAAGHDRASRCCSACTW